MVNMVIRQTLLALSNPETCNCLLENKKGFMWTVESWTIFTLPNIICAWLERFQLTASITGDVSNTMEELWRRPQGLTLRECGENRYLFKFDRETELENVLKKEHWSLD